MVRHAAITGFLMLVGCGSTEAIFHGFQKPAPKPEIEEFTDTAEPERASATTEVASPVEAEQPELTAAAAEDDGPVSNEVVDDGDEELPEAEVLYDTRGAWTLRFDDLRSGKHHIVGCLGSASHRYAAPTLEDVELYREQLYQELLDLNRDTFTVWTSTPDPNNGIGFYVIDLMSGDVSTDVSVFGGRHNVLCMCPDQSLGAECGGTDPLGTALDVQPVEISTIP